MLADLILVMIFFIGIASGYRDGFVKSIFGIIGLFLGIWAAIALTGSVVDMLPARYSEANKMPIIVAIILFIVTVGFFSAIAEALRSVLKMLFLGVADKFLGAFLGLFNTAVFVGILTWASIQLGFFEEQRESSVILGSVYPLMQGVYAWFVENVGLMKNLDVILENLFPSE